MQTAIVRLIRRLMAQKIAVRPRFPELLVRFLLLLPDGQGDGAVRMLRLDLPYERAHPLIGIIRVLPAL